MSVNGTLSLPPGTSDRGETTAVRAKITAVHDALARPHLHAARGLAEAFWSGETQRGR
jgi:hypothetical protein